MMNAFTIEKSNLSSIFENELEKTKDQIKNYYLALLKNIKTLRSVQKEITKVILLDNRENLLFKFKNSLTAYIIDQRVISDKIVPEKIDFSYYSIEIIMQIIKVVEELIELIKKVQ